MNAGVSCLLNTTGYRLSWLVVRTYLKWFLLMTITMIPLPAFAESISQHFPELEEIRIKSRWDVKVLYSPEITKVIDRKYHDTDADLDRWEVLRTRLTEQGEEYLIEFNEGFSDDPQFRVLRLDGTEPREIFMSFGTGLVIPGNGSMYVSGHTNNTFDERKKFQLKNGMVTEVKQPFMYVGLDSKTTRDIVLYSTTEQNEIVAQIPAGAPVSVVLNTGGDYLVKTPFGLLGWTRIPPSNTVATIEGLLFAGD